MQTLVQMGMLHADVPQVWGRLYVQKAVVHRILGIHTCEAACNDQLNAIR